MIPSALLIIYFVSKINGLDGIRLVDTCDLGLFSNHLASYWMSYYVAGHVI